MWNNFSVSAYIRFDLRRTLTRSATTHHCGHQLDLPMVLIGAPFMVVACRSVRGAPLNAATIEIGRAHVNSSHQIISYAVFCLKKTRRARSSRRQSSTE